MTGGWNTQVLALLVDAAGATMMALPIELRAFKDAIGGGFLEAIGVAEDTDAMPAWHAYVDEEGKLKHLPANVSATRLARAAGWAVDDVLYGPALFLGTAGPDETDVPAPLVTLARGYCTIPDPYVCPHCTALSWRPLDLRYRYCHRCRRFGNGTGPA